MSWPGHWSDMKATCITCRTEGMGDRRGEGGQARVGQTRAATSGHAPVHLTHQMPAAAAKQMCSKSSALLPFPLLPCSTCPPPTPMLHPLPLSSLSPRNACPLPLNKPPHEPFLAPLGGLP